MRRMLVFVWFFWVFFGDVFFLIVFVYCFGLVKCGNFFYLRFIVLVKCRIVGREMCIYLIGVNLVFL